VRTAALTLLAVLAALMLVPAALGYERYVIGGGSMGSTVPRGSIAYEQRVPVGALRVGDVITYTPPGRADRVTHRIVSIAPGGVLRTKGDANAAPDPWTFTLPAREQAVVRFHVPFAGYAFIALGVRWVRMLVIGLPALLVALVVLRDGRREPLAT
jgi:signal peptidase I